MQRNHIQGTQNNDFLTDAILDDDIFGLDGDDQIKVSSGNDLVDGGEGNDELAIDYSDSNEDVDIVLNSYSNRISQDGSINIFTPQSGNNNKIGFNNIESLLFNSGSGNDNIDLGYDNFSDDEVNAGAGDDFISALRAIVTIMVWLYQYERFG